MAEPPVPTVLQHLRRLAGARGPAALTDAQLLGRWVGQRDEAAFEVLLWRHGPLVWNVCTRLLRRPAEAEDAFQATFLILVRKAGSVGKGESVGSWLYKVAYRVALAARTAAARHPTAPLPPEGIPAPEAADTEWRDLRPVLDEEINRLPGKYRTPFVLCYLQGKTNEEAAAELGCPKGTVATRLAWARERLRVRLGRRGVTCPAAALVAVGTHQASAADVSAALVAASVKLAAPATASVPVVALSQGVMRIMLIARLRSVAVVVVMVALLGGGAVVLARQVVGTRPAGGAAQAPAGEPQAGKKESNRIAVKPDQAPPGPSDTLRYYLSRSPLVLAGAITSDPVGTGMKTVTVYHFDFRPTELIAGRISEVKSVEIAFTRLETAGKENGLSFLKKGAKCLVFVRPVAGHPGRCEVVDMWFGVQPYSADMARLLKEIAAEK